MPPSTKNLRERISQVLHADDEKRDHDCNVMVCRHVSTLEDDLFNLLSSELSLAIKGLREEMENVIVGDYGLMSNEAHMLAAFDSKAKEILGVLTHED